MTHRQLSQCVDVTLMQMAGAQIYVTHTRTHTQRGEEERKKEKKKRKEKQPSRGGKEAPLKEALHSLTLQFSSKAALSQAGVSLLLFFLYK